MLQLSKEIEVVDEMVVADVAQLGMAGGGKLKDDSINLVYAETPDFVGAGQGDR